MGQVNATLYYRLIVTLFCIAINVTAAPKIGTLRGVKFPEYRDNGILEYMLYSKVAKPRGVIVDLQDVLVDFVQPNVKVNEIEDNRFVKLYTIKEASKLDKKIPEFWAKYFKTKIFCRTSKAMYDRSTQLLQGDYKVLFRSKYMDVDGVGFDMDQKNGKLHIRKNVHVVLRENDDKDKKSSSFKKENNSEK